MVLAVGLLLGMFAPSTVTGPGMMIARQPDAPAQITRTVHGIPEALQAATFENRSTKTIVACRIGWIDETGGVSRTHAGSWNQLAASVAPGGSGEVPAQGIGIDYAAQKMTFLVTEVRFADGSSWKAPEVSATPSVVK